MNSKLVIGLAGMPGAGKSVVVNVAKESGYGIIVMGDAVREEAQKRHLEPSPENLGKIMLELRQKEGNNVIAKRCIPKIKSEAKHKVIVDGFKYACYHKTMLNRKRKQR
jgi:dephospho-CoA kinase